MVRVTVTASKWSTWKRYCDSAGISMGRAIGAMIDRELVAVFSESAGDPSPVFADQAEEELARRQEQVARRELDAVRSIDVAPLLHPSTRSGFRVAGSTWGSYSPLLASIRSRHAQKPEIWFGR